MSHYILVASYAWSDKTWSPVLRVITGCQFGAEQLYISYNYYIISKWTIVTNCTNSTNIKIQSFSNGSSKFVAFRSNVRELTINQIRTTPIYARYIPFFLTVMIVGAQTWLNPIDLWFSLVAPRGDLCVGVMIFASVPRRELLFSRLFYEQRLTEIRAGITNYIHTVKSLI